MNDVSYNILDLSDYLNNEETEIFESSRNEIMHAINILEDYGIVNVKIYEGKVPGTEADTKAMHIRCNFIIAETPLNNEARGYSLTKDEVNMLFHAYLNWKAANE